MKPIPVLRVLFILFISTLFSCKSANEKAIKINPNWQKLSLPNGWIIYAPKGFEIKTGQGVDSEPGWILSKKDSITLEFDSGPYDYYYYKHCDLHENFLREKANIDTGLYETTYQVPLINRAYIDTVDNRIALIIRPIQKGHGLVTISTGDCNHGAWLGITGTNLTSKKERIVLEIYKTVKLVQTN